MKRISAQNHRRTKVASRSIAWSFFLLGTVNGNIASVMPYVVIEHGFAEDMLGAIFIFESVGAIAGGYVAAKSIARWGSCAVTVYSSLLIMLTIVLIGGPPLTSISSGKQPEAGQPESAMGPSYIICCVGLTIVNMSIAILDVAINDQAVLCEKYGQTSMMGMFHSTYAVGAAVGALFGGGLMEAKDFRLLSYQELGVYAAAVLVPCVWYYRPRALFSHSEEEVINGDVVVDRNDDDKKGERERRSEDEDQGKEEEDEEEHQKGEVENDPQWKHSFGSIDQQHEGDTIDIDRDRPSGAAANRASCRSICSTTSIKTVTATTHFGGEDEGKLFTATYRRYSTFVRGA
jgi:hypothetical protein